MAVDKLQHASGNSASTTSSGSVTDSDTALPLTSDTNFSAKSGEGMVIIDEGTATEELAYATTKAGSSLTIPLANRGLEGGSPQAHGPNVSVKGIFSAGMWNNLVDALITLVDKTTGLLDTTKVVDLATAQTLETKTLTSPLFQGAVDGWISADASWTYASASTITVPAGATSKYKKGDKIKLTQTTVKYWHIASVADTVLTIIVNTDYTLANAAITLNYYSRVTNPIGFPNFFNFTSTVTGMTTATATLQYTILEGMVYVFMANTSQTSNSATFNVTGPVVMSGTPGSFFQGGLGILDNGAWLATQGVSGIFADTNLIKLGKDATTFAGNAFGGFTATGGKAVQGIIGYTI